MALPYAWVSTDNQNYTMENICYCTRMEHNEDIFGTFRHLGTNKISGTVPHFGNHEELQEPCTPETRYCLISKHLAFSYKTGRQHCHLVFINRKLYNAVWCQWQIFISYHTWTMQSSSYIRSDRLVRSQSIRPGYPITTLGSPSFGPSTKKCTQMYTSLQ